MLIEKKERGNKRRSGGGGLFHPPAPAESYSESKESQRETELLDDVIRMPSCVFMHQNQTVCMNEGEIYTKMLLKDFRFQVNSLNTCSSEDSVKKADFIDAKRGEISIQPFKNI